MGNIIISLMMGGSGSGPLEYIDFAKNTDSAGNWSLDISGVDFASGDLGIFLFGSKFGDSSYTVNINGTNDGFTEIEKNTDEFVGAVILGGDETSITSSTGTDFEDSAMIFFVYRNAKIPTNYERTASIISNPNPPELTTINSTSVVITPAFTSAKSLTPTPPSGYTLIASSANSADVNSVMVASKSSPSSTEDPGAYSDAYAGGWSAHTIEIPWLYED